MRDKWFQRRDFSVFFFFKVIFRSEGCLGCSSEGRTLPAVIPWTTGGAELLSPSKAYSEGSSGVLRLRETLSRLQNLLGLEGKGFPLLVVKPFPGWHGEYGHACWKCLVVRQDNLPYCPYKLSAFIWLNIPFYILLFSDIQNFWFLFKMSIVQASVVIFP